VTGGGGNPSIRVRGMPAAIGASLFIPADAAGTTRRSQSEDDAEGEVSDDEPQTEMTDKRAHAASSVISFGVVAASQRSQ